MVTCRTACSQSAAFFSAGFSSRSSALELSRLRQAAQKRRHFRSFSKGPYIQFPAPGCASIMWESLTNTTASVRFGIGDNLDSFAGGIVAERMSSLSGTGGVASGLRTNTFYLYEALLTHLKCGERYSYDVQLKSLRPRHENSGHWIPYCRERSFRRLWR